MNSSEERCVLDHLFEFFPEVPNKTLPFLAHHAVECVKLGRTECFTQFFQLVEHYIIFGNDAVRNMLITGLLESMKNFSAWDELDYAVFEGWLGPETHVAWRWLEKRWQGKNSLADAARNAD